MRTSYGLFFSVCFCLGGALAPQAIAAEYALASGFTARTVGARLDGAIAALPNGDILSASPVRDKTGKFIGDIALYRLPRDGYGLYFNDKRLLLTLDFPANDYPTVQTVRVSPNGKFALILLDFTYLRHQILKVNLVTTLVEELISVPYPDHIRDLAFIDDSSIYLSYHAVKEGEARVYRVTFAERLLTTPLVAIPDSYFVGPIALFPNGDLAVLFRRNMNTSETIAKFGQTELMASAQSGEPITQSILPEIQLSTNGFPTDLVPVPGETGGFFLTDGSPYLYQIDSTGIQQTLVELQSATPGAALFGFSIARQSIGPWRIFGLSQDPQQVQATLVEVYPTTLDSDSDGTTDTLDICPFDAGKSAPGYCGCGAPELDSNSDGLIDCGVSFEVATSTRPRITQFAVKDRKLNLRLEKFRGKDVRYTVTVRNDTRKTKKILHARRSRISVLTRHPGQFRISFYATAIVDRKEIRSRSSEPITLAVQ